MSSFSRRALLLALPALAACGFEPVYGTGGPANGLRGKIIIDAPTDENSFNMTAHLEQRLGRAEAPVYGLLVTTTIEEEGLAITGSNDITRFNVLGDAQYILRDVRTGEELINDTVNSFTSYSASQQPVATLAAERDAERRLMIALADKIVAYILSQSERL
jgi:LPS-assembly lipoprotein